MRKWIAVVGIVVLAAAVGAVAATLTDRLAFEAVAAPQLQWPLDGSGNPLPGPFVHVNCDNVTGDRLYIAASRETSGAVTIHSLAVVGRGCADWPDTTGVAPPPGTASIQDAPLSERSLVAFGDGR